ncbi:MAG: AraC family transcriptional regulator [Steroidobacteraceae bacterium]
MTTRSEPANQTEDSASTVGSVTLIAGYGRVIAQALELRGIDSRRIFAAAGISDALKNDPLMRLPVDTITRMYRASVEATGDPYFGLQVASVVGAATLHALGYGLLASSTLADYCKRVQRYFGLVSQAARVEILPRGDTVCFSTVPIPGVCAETQDMWLGLMYRMMRQLYVGELPLVGAELPHPVPAAGDAPYVEFFGAPVRFDCRAATLILPRRVMEVPLQGACPELAQLNDNLAATYLARLDRSDVVANVRARIVELLPSGECSKTRVAAGLYMSPTTLQKRLLDRGTSFHELLNDIRRELACSYLRQSGVSVTEITFLLGFTDVSNFTRAFKRWTGTSPTQYRDQA